MSSTEFQLLRERLERLYNELRVMEEQLHPIISRLRTVLGEFLGVEAVAAPPPTPTPPTPAEAPRILVAEAPAPAAAPRPPELPPERTLLFMLLTEITKGIKLARYRDHKFVVASEPITYEGNTHDLGQEYDVVILSPSIDTQIEIDRPVEPNTPVIFANTFLNIDNMVVRRIYYKGVSPVLKGKMSIWAFKY
jgi:hypothetical protein